MSLFDGISCLMVALGDREIEEYQASEIDKHAIKVSKTNYPDIKQLGDVKEIKGIENIDLLCGGSPCVDLSVAKNNRKGLEGEKSSLFYEYLRILRETKPKWFILENVNSMPKKDRDIITKEMGVEPIMIDAALVSAQSRKRLFWTNIPVVGLPTDRKILLKDILQPDAEVDKRMATTDGKAFCLKARYNGATEKHSVKTHQSTMVKTGIVYVGAVEGNIRKGMEGQEHLSRSQFEGNRVYSDEGKAKTVTANGGGKGGNSGLYKVGHIGNSDAQTNRVYSDEGKSVTLSANGRGLGAKTGLYQITERIRKLTPIECERLQSLPDDYTKGISNTQRYRCLGNAFNVEVIKFILSFIPENGF